MPTPSYGPPATADVWAASSAFHTRFLVGEPDETLTFALTNSVNNGLPEIAVSPSQGKLLNLFVRTLGAKRIIEVGTLGGYSTIWLARALPADGKLVTFELSEKHAKVARENLEHAGVADRVEVIVGPAAETLAKFGGDATFDFAFIDADKAGYPIYTREAKRLVRSGGAIILDNVVRNGYVADMNKADKENAGVRDLLKYLQEDTELEAATVPTADERGFDGWAYVLRK
ncbi:O-methyltransferase [Schizophyllum commune Tattone D]|nr:O-methyltransferase [Schizophyllum commune Tattone D]